MNLEELKNALKSDATKRADDLEKELADLKKMQIAYRQEMEEKVDGLKNDCRALTNRCWVLTRGLTCIHCSLSAYQCEHSLSDTEKIEKAMEIGGMFR